MKTSRYMRSTFAMSRACLWLTAFTATCASTHARKLSQRKPAQRWPNSHATLSLHRWQGGRFQSFPSQVHLSKHTRAQGMQQCRQPCCRCLQAASPRPGFCRGALTPPPPAQPTTQEPPRAGKPPCKYCILAPTTTLRGQHRRLRCAAQPHGACPLGQRTQLGHSLACQSIALAT